MVFRRIHRTYYYHYYFYIYKNRKGAGMKLVVTQENLSRALQVVGRVASGKTPLPILNNILFRTDKNRLLLAATNLELAVTQYVGSKVEVEGSITVPARLMSEF